MQKRRVVTDNASLRSLYNELTAGDLVVGRVRLRASEEVLLLDLVERGVQLFPAALAQLASRSKALQARLFSSWMLPLTMAVHDLHDLREAMNIYAVCRTGAVVTKLDRKNAGQGIFRWSCLEDVFNQASLGVLPFPFVLQPFVAETEDIRAVFLDDYVEAYRRESPLNFRNNMHFGGLSTPCALTVEQQRICRAVMERGKFPYAHIDLMVGKGGDTYLSEINLRGGIRGARIKAREYQARIAAIHATAMAQLGR
ncbi:ATP-grasp domain-containing protein [Thiovibrio sp. JS02]